MNTNMVVIKPPELALLKAYLLDLEQFVFGTNDEGKFHLYEKELQLGPLSR